MFVLVFLALLLSSYVIAADLPYNYKLGYFIALVFIVGLIILSIAL